MGRFSDWLSDLGDSLQDFFSPKKEEERGPEDGVSENRARQFSRVCLGKLRDELLVRGEVARV